MYDKSLTLRERVAICFAAKTVLTLWEEAMKLGVKGKHFLSTLTMNDATCTRDGLIIYLCTVVLHFPNDDSSGLYIYIGTRGMRMVGPKTAF